MVAWYIYRIKAGKMTIDEVALLWRKQVEEKLKEA